MSAPPTRDTIDDLANRAKRWIVLEGLLFETLGAWARHVPEPAVKRTMAAWCHRHAWHAELWRSRLPVLDGRDTRGDDNSDGTDGDVASWLDPLQRALGNLDPTMTTDARLVILVDPVLAAVRSALDEHRAAIDPRLDGPTSRVLDLVSADLDAEVAALQFRDW